jgi:hypothetical protein
VVEFLITLPEHDDITDYCSKWSKAVIDVAKEEDHSVTKLEGPNATRANFEKRTKKQKPKFVMFNGHGDSKNITGHSEEVVLTCESRVKNEKITKGKIIYARACDCGAELGPACVDAGCKAFVGYKKNFAIIKSKSRVAKPLNDPIARPFLEISNEIPIFILKGNTVKEAVKKADLKLEKELETLMTKDTFMASHILPWLIWNKKVRVVLGDKSAKVS